MKRKHFWVMLIVIFGIIDLALIINVNSGYLYRLNDYAVDSSGNIYLGKHGIIEVYSKDKKHVKNIKIPTSTRYYFDVDDNIILLGTGDKIYRTNLDGIVISIEEDRFSNMTNSLASDWEWCVDEHGNKYYYSHSFLERGCLYDNNGKIIYQEPLRNFVCIRLMWLSSSMLPICVFFLIKTMNEKKE